jgi:glutathione S-transferase
MALLSAGLPYEMVEVESAPRSSKMGDDYLKLTPGGQALRRASTAARS